jgi:hypothetical protein
VGSKISNELVSLFCFECSIKVLNGYLLDQNLMEVIAGSL